MKTVNVELTHEEAKTIMTILGQHCWQEGFEDKVANLESRACIRMVSSNRREYATTV